MPNPSAGSCLKPNSPSPSHSLHLPEHTASRGRRPLVLHSLQDTRHARLTFSCPPPTGNASSCTSRLEMELGKEGPATAAVRAPQTDCGPGPAILIQGCAGGRNESLRGVGFVSKAHRLLELAFAVLQPTLPKGRCLGRRVAL